MVHCLTLKNVLPDAFKHSHHDIAVREHQTEETALHFLELVLVLQCLEYLLLGALLFFLGSDFLGYSVVLGFKVVGTNVMWTSDVFAHFYQHTDVVRPFADVCNKVMVAVGYLVGIPTSFQVPWMVYEVADVSVTTLFHHRFDAVVCQHRLEQCKRFDAVKCSVKAVAPYLRNDFHIGADRK